MAKTPVSDFTTHYGETLPLDEWLSEVESDWDALTTDLQRQNFVAARYNALADGDPRKDLFKSSQYFEVPPPAPVVAPSA